MFRKRLIPLLILSLVWSSSYAVDFVTSGQMAERNAYQNEIMRQQAIREQMENERLKRQYQEEENRKKQAQQINDFIQQLTASASQGDAEAQYTLGKVYYDGQIVQPNPQTAAYWWQRAAMQGHAIAQSSLGGIYSSGLGVDQDYKKALQWRMRAAEQGEPSAQVGLGSMYLLGQGVPKNARKGMYWLKKAAKAGHTLATEIMAWAYYQGDGVPKNKVYAYALFKYVSDRSENAGKALSILEGEMTSKEIAKAQSLSAEDILNKK